jgi:hypothetical protein
MKPMGWVSILWPSFVVAGVANALFFTVFDPEELIAFGEPVNFSRIGAYSLGFFGFWAVGSASLALARFLHGDTGNINQQGGQQ